MSVGVMSAVWQHSEATGNTRLVLLAIADWADDEGRAWPSLEAIAKKAKMSRRTVIRCVSELIGLGELARTHGGGMRGPGGITNGYAIVLGGVTTGTSAKPSPVTNEVQGGVSSAPSGDTGGTRTTRTTKTRHGANRTTATPDTITITDGMRAWADKNKITVDLVAETDRMLDYHRAKGSRFANWTAAWNNWMRNTLRYGSPNEPAAGTDRFSAPDLG